MKVIVKKLQGGECMLEVFPNTFISEMKAQIASKLGVPVDEQKILLHGRILADEQMVQTYPQIKDGTKLNLIVKKPEGLLEAAVKYYKNKGYSEKDAIKIATRLVKIVDQKIFQMSWDDIERLSYNFLSEEDGGVGAPTSEQETECDDSLTL